MNDTGAAIISGDHMGWQGQHNRDEADEAEWRKLPLRERYDWPSVALFVVFLSAFVYALWSGK